MVNSWTFRHGFVDYVNQLEEKKLDPLLADIGQIYQQKGNWDWVHDEHELWKDVVDRQFRRPPRRGRPPRDERPGPPPHTLGNSPISIDRHILLQDSQRHLIIGRNDRNPKIQWKPVKIEDTIVGYIGYRPREQLSDQLDQIFSSQQQRSFAWAALVLVLISSVIAFPLAARLIKPISQINAGAKKLAAGDYKHRLSYKGRDELGELSNSFNRLAQTLEKNLSARQHWIADISHELRTPVAILQGEIEALQDGVRTVGPGTLSSLHTETARLTRLIEDLNQLALSDQGALSYQMEEVDLTDLIQNCIDASSTKANTHNLTLRLECDAEPKSLSGDPQRLSQLITNLLQNSIRYTHADGQLLIKLTSISGTIIIDWEDSSPGVEDEQLPLLFDRLYRADPSRSQEFGGSGLGLSICEKIVEAHAGVITTLHSKLGGLHIRIELPVT